MENSSEFTNLDSKELMHLAIKASNDNDHAKSIQYLKEIQKISPDPMALYILAAEHAQIGMYQEAIEEITTVLEAIPDLWPARIQLTLLYLITNNSQAGHVVLEPMIQLPTENCFSDFSAGLQHFINGEHVSAIEFLTRGLDKNNTNIALNNDIKNLIEQIRSNISEKKSTDNNTTEDKHLFINAYNDSV